MQQGVVLELASAVLGLLIGSWLNVVIYRLPLMLAAPEAQGRYNLAWPRSHCPACHHPLAWWHNVPLLSFILLRGHCRWCRAPISRRYPLVEGLTALCFAFLASQFDSPALLAASMCLSAWLIALAAIDIETGLLPDVLTLPLMWCGLLFNLWRGAGQLESAVLGAVAGYLLLWLLYWAFRLVTGKEGLGYGDFKLLAALGAWLGYAELPQVLLLSSLTGLLAGGILMFLRRMARHDPLPFGPYLALSGWVVWVWSARF